MKRLLITLFSLIILFPYFANALNSSTDSIDQKILNELQEIHSLQLESKTERESTRHERIVVGNRDSIDIPSNEYGAMLHIVDNTKQDRIYDGWNLFGALTILVALITGYFAFRDYIYQKRTARHTQNAPINAQIGVLKDIPRHFYRNLVCTCAMLFKFRHPTNYKDNKRLAYPSEANVLKLSTLSDEFILPIDSTDEIIYKKMHEEKLLFKNYNIEISVASNHFSNSNISDESMKNDYDNLLFKPFMLIAEMYVLQDEILFSKNIKNESETNVMYTMYAFVKEHFSKMDYNKFLKKDSSNNISLLQEMDSKENFIKSIGILPDSIDRGIKKILTYKEKNNNIHSFIEIIEDNKENEIIAYIYKNKFKDFFINKINIEEKYNSKKDDIIKNFELALSIKDINSFKNSSEIPKDFSDENAKNLMKSYFNFFQNEKWELKELIYTILKVDTILELNKIGMINY